MIEIVSGTTVDGVTYTEIKRGTNYTRHNKLYVRYDSESGYFHLAGADSAAYLTFKRAEVSLPISIDDLDLLDKLTNLTLLPVITTGGGGGGGATEVTLQSVKANQTNGTQKTEITGSLPVGSNIIGAITIADGQLFSLGSINDPAAPLDNSNTTLISLFKRALQKLSTIISWITRNTTEVETQVNITTTALTPTLAANSNRRSLKIFNPPGSPAIRVSYGTPVPVQSLRIPAGGANGVLYEFPQPVPLNALHIVTIAGASTITIVEG